MLTLLSAAGVVAVYGGRSWCHYVCPFGMVQTVFTGPRGLLDRQAHTAPPFSITQSMCRTMGEQGEESACISCKSACMDIDAEQSYWTQMHKPGRKLVQYGYLGLVIGYFCYYRLYAGNFEYYFSGVWSYEARTVEALFDPGFYVARQAIAIPKIIAAPLTLATFAAVSCWICARIERHYRGYLKATSLHSATAGEKSLHRMFSICTFIAFNIFFVYGGRPEINGLPIAVQFAFQTLIAVVSSLWLYRTWGRSEAQYHQEGLVDKHRRQLKKLGMDVDELLSKSNDSPTLEQMSEETISVLAEVLPHLRPRPTEESFEDVVMPQTLIRKHQMNRPLSEQDVPRTAIH